MCRQDHSYPVDYYAVGVIAYEMMIGKRPYNGRDRKEIRDNILAKQVQLTEDDLPNGWSTTALDFVNRVRHSLNKDDSKEAKQQTWLEWHIRNQEPSLVQISWI